MAIGVFDGHNDVLLEERSFADACDDGHLDLAHENFLRVLRQVQNAASSRAMPTGSS